MRAKSSWRTSPCGAGSARLLLEPQCDNKFLQKRVHAAHATATSISLGQWQWKAAQLLCSLTRHARIPWTLVRQAAKVTVSVWLWLAKPARQHMC